MLKTNLEYINSEISKARAKSPYGQEVSLIAVSKTHPVSVIKEAYDLGVRDFGENRVQELLEKIDKLPSDIRWHLIGHLQANKVKYIVDKVYMIHSVDSVKLAEEIEKQAAKKDVTVKILIQLNISHEESKFGADARDAQEMIDIISRMPHIKIMGFMTIAPFTDDAETVRDIFRKLKKLSIDIELLNNDNNRVCTLSMGMSGDFSVAIEEGATMVRIGTGIFGERDYSI